MKLILRNFFITLKRFKLASGLNIFGLGVAFTALMVMITQIGHELSFDKFHAKADHIFRIEGSAFDPADPGRSAIHTYDFIQEFNHSSPHVQAGTAMMLLSRENYFSVGEEGAEAGYREMFIPTDRHIGEVFDFRMVEGTSESLAQPYTALIPQSIATKVFGSENAVGKLIHPKERIFMTTEGTPFTVGGVYEDFPANSQLHNGIYFPMDETLRYLAGGRNYQAYLVLDNPANAQAVVDNFMAKHWREDSNYADNLTLVPITDIYYHPALHDPFQKMGDRRVTALLILTAVLITLIAAINFTNFSVSLAPVRIRSINTQKILGNPTARIRAHLILEAVGISLVAYVLAIAMLHLFSLSDLSGLLTANMGVAASPPALWMGFGIALAIGFVAGIYPAFYMTAFAPALVLKGSFGLSTRGRKLRSVLIGLQYTVSIVLIVAALFIRLQNKFMLNHSLGFDTDQVVLVQIGTDLYQNSHQTYVNRLRAFSGIEDVAFSQQKFGGQESYEGHSFIKGDQEFPYQMLKVSPNFLEVFDIPLLEGRNFTPADESRPEMTTLVVNQKMHLDHGVDLERHTMRGYNFDVIGVMGNVHSASLRSPIGPMAFGIETGGNELFRMMPYSYVKIAAGTPVPAVIDHIRATVKELDPTYPLEIEFYDQIARQQYAQDIRLSRLITLFCLVAVGLSLVGVFGLVVFETQYRRKEIGVRKVFGASVREILRLMNQTYTRIVLICFTIAAPAAYVLIRKWLENFSYRTPMHFWVFAVALMTILVITSLTVIIQSYRAAIENPVHSLRGE